MPDPGKYHGNKEKFISDCVKVVMKEGKNQQQSLGQCYGMWKEHEKKSKASTNLNMKNNEKSTKESKSTDIAGTKVPNMDVAFTPGQTKTTASDFESAINGTLNERQVRFDLDITKSKNYKKPLFLDKKNQLSEFDRAEASYMTSTSCDMCGSTISKYDGKSNYVDSYPSKGSIDLSLEDDKGHPQGHKYCSESCLLGSLLERHKQRKEQLEKNLQKHKDVEDKTNKLFKSGNETDADDAMDSSTASQKKIEEIIFAANKKEHGHDSPPKGYPNTKTEYADPKNYKYPVNSPERVRAAWNYIHHPKNSGEYSSSELSAIKTRIREAAKRHGVNLSENK